MNAFDIAFTAGMAQFEGQISAIDGIESKTGMLLTAVGTVLTILTSFIAASSIIKINIFLVGGIILLFVSLILCVISLWSRIFKHSLKIKKFYEAAIGKTDYEIQSSAISVIDKALETNRGKLLNKGVFFNIALIIFIISFIFISVGFGIQLENRWQLV